VDDEAHPGSQAFSPYSASGPLVSVVVGICASGLASVLAIVLVGFFNSIMFPTIFALSLKNLGPLTKRGFVAPGDVDHRRGPLIPAAMGRVSDVSNIRIAFVMPVVCYAYVIYFALKGYKPDTAPAHGGIRDSS